MAEVNDHLQQNLDDLTVLWPWLNMTDKLKWWDVMRDHFDDDMQLFLEVMDNGGTSP